MQAKKSADSGGRLAIFGPICKDLILLYNSNNAVERVGGPVLYGYQALEKLAVESVIFPILNAIDKSLLGNFNSPHILVEPLWHSQTAVCKLRYLDERGDKRQVELSAAPHVVERALPIISSYQRQIETLHLGTATPFDIDNDLVLALSELSFNLSLDLQGPLRSNNMKIKEILSWLSKISILKVDLAEGQRLCNMKSPDRIAKQLHEWGAKAVLVTDGSNGSWVCDQDHNAFVPAQPIDPSLRDTTGCGDLFVVSFMHYYRHADIVEAAMQSTELVAVYLRDAAR
jgi:hypothetical protein